MGFVKIDRKLIHWKYFKRPNYTQVWMYLLCRANFKQGNSLGIQINPGQTFETYASISRNTGVPRSSVRNIIRHMVLDRQLDIKSVTDLDTQLDSKLASGGIIITIVNWHTYQDSEKTVGQPVGQDVGQSFGHGNGHGKVQQSEEGYSEEGFQKKKEAHPSDEKPKAKYKDWNEDWKYTDSRGNKYDWGYMVRNFGDNAENMARIIVDEDRKSRS